jgi:hypothetical protein
MLFFLVCNRIDIVFEFSLKILATTATRLLVILALKILRAFVTGVNFFKESPNVVGIFAFFDLLENIVNVFLGTHIIAS